ncbi:LuxR C-terminal-related transcriptional regulator [Actinomadura sp. 3N508]|uniref:LuxR C-terminal-related transcriptional regulator n=1 Tax=Actinomadura sp. 3N508 TaxID=3375153 RepID=UPI0037B469DA
MAPEAAPGTTAKGSGPAGSLPDLPHWAVPRPELTERMSEAVQGPVTLITGPPGAGKTTTALAWAATAAGPPGPIACWVACDDSTATVRGFCLALRGSLTRAGIDVPSTERGPGHHPEARDDDMLDAITTALRTARTPVVVVVDDVPARPGSAAADVLSHLLRHTGPRFRAAVLSRGDAPLPLHRHRLAGELTEIRAADLAFGDREIAAVLAQHGVRPDPASVRALRERTGGWPAAIRLAAMSMEHHPDPEGFAARFGGDDQGVVGYLMEEVVDAQPPGARWLLLATSVTDRVNAELARDLAAPAGRAFPDLVRQNAFAEPLGQGWYRYHPMLGRALRQILQHESPGMVPELHRRAATWFERAGLLPDAVRQAVLAGDWHYASRMVVERLAIGPVLGLRPHDALLGVLDGIPDTAAFTGAGPEPAIVAAAVAARRRDEASCTAALRHAKRVLRRSPPDVARPARWCLAAVELSRLGATGFAGLAGASGEAALLSQAPARRLDDRPELRALALSGRGAAHVWHGELHQAARHFGAALTAAERAGGDFQTKRCLGDLALTEALLGNAARATELAGRARRLPDVPAPPDGGASAAALLAETWADVDRWRLQEARGRLGQMARASSGPADPVSSAVHHLLKARADLCQGRPDHALDDLRAAEEITPRPRWLDRRLALIAAEANVARGEVEAARRDARRADGPDAGRAASLESSLALAYADVRAGADRTASALLKEALRRPARAPLDVRVDAWLLDACLAYRDGDPRHGRRSLDRALGLARREEIRRPFAMARSWLRPVLHHDPELLHAHHPLLEPLGLLVRTGAVPSPGTNEPDMNGTAPVERLSPRELEVLRSVAQLMTTQEIAANLYVSVNTVKTHLKSINRKLAVTRRAEAVRRAHQLSLL